MKKVFWFIPVDVNFLDIVLICGEDNKFGCVVWSLVVVISTCCTSVVGWKLDVVPLGFSVVVSAEDSSFMGPLSFAVVTSARISSVITDVCVGTVFDPLVSAENINFF